MKKILVIFLLIFLSLPILGQNCSILAKANNITPDKLCSPVTVNWIVTYTGVNNAGRPVQVFYDWNDGNTQTANAINIAPGVYQTTLSHIYTSAGNVCNYHPQATLVVNGVLCTSSAQEQIVTVWDDDDHNGGEMHINPTVYPICVGNGDNVRFQDLTQFNCVPPQENDVPNLFTRWIQWIYGTDITMTGIPVTINGTPRIFPYTAPVITLPGPVTGSGVWSDVINVANDKLVGQYFQVTLRNWNYCNPYDDPNIPGPPVDVLNGDHPPVVTTAIILIVPYPDATITPVSPMCLNGAPIILTAHDPGGTWSGPGVFRGNRFDPAIAGVGTHTITYSLTGIGGCTDIDQINITVVPLPDATITPIGIQCFTGPRVLLTAHDPGGIWSGLGVVGNMFDPGIAGIGNHIITYIIVDVNGCASSDQTSILVIAPDATITPVNPMCADAAPVILNAHDPGGTWSGTGVIGNTFNPFIAGPGNHRVRYSIINANCNDFDEITITVYPVPDATITPVGVVCIDTISKITLISHDIGGVWTGNGVIGNTFDPVVAGIGSHLIKYNIINANGCSDEDEITIDVVPAPDATITPVPPLCLNNSIITLTSKDLGGVWSGKGVIGNTFDPAVAGIGNHVITYFIADPFCSDVDQITITILPVPDATITPVGVVCINDSNVTLAAQDSGGTWLGKGVSGNIFNPRIAGVGSHLITYNITNSSGCFDTDNITIDVVASPDATIIPVDTMCVNNSPVTLTTRQPGGIWSGAISTNVFNPSVLGVGDHVVIYTITNSYRCVDVDQITISVMPVPIVQITPVRTLFINEPPVVLNATPINGVFSGNGITGNMFNPNAAGLGTHVVKYQTIPDRFGCLAFDTIHIKVIMPPLPISKFDPDTTGCSPLNVPFVNNSVGASSYLWDFGDNVFSVEENPIHVYYTPGKYVVRLIATNVSGQTTSKRLVTVFQNPSASFTIYPTEVTNNSQVVVFYNYSMYDAYRLWKFGDGSTSIEDNPWHKYTAEGVYNVTLIVTSKDGCIDSLSSTTPIKVQYNVGKLAFPNAFIWNQSGPTGGYWTEGQVDDAVFRPHFENVLEYKLQIFNRWGVLIYESYDLHKGWDGYFANGSLAVQGVYVWKATGRYIDGTYFDKVGDVTFLH